MTISYCDSCEVKNKLSDTRCNTCSEGLRKRGRINCLKALSKVSKKQTTSK